MPDKYNVIYADPPWKYANPAAIVGNGGRGKHNIENAVQVNVEKQYPTMTVDEIKALPVKSFAAKDSVLFLWTTNSFLVEAHEIAKTWGFKTKTMITWGKVKKDNGAEPSMSVGHWFRSASEHLLFGIKGHPKRPEGFMFPTLVLHHRMPHSVKPDIFYDIIEKASPGPYVELFARRERDGWARWGNEVQSTVELK